MEKMIPKSPRSGKKAAGIVAMLVAAACIAFSSASRMSPGLALVVVVGAALVLLAFAVFEAAQWVWRSRPDRD